MNILDWPRKLVGEFNVSKRTINGTVVRIPYVGNHGRKNTKEHEDFLDRFLESSLDNISGAFIDVGANIGQILIKVKTHSPTVQYIGFEPSAFCASYAERVIDINGFTKAQIFPFALSDKFQFLTFFHSDGADEQATTVPDFWTERNARSKVKKVACLRGDDVISRLDVGKIGILKIDVEGGELEVLKGFEQTIVRDKPLILVEILPHLKIETVVSVADRQIMSKRRERIEQTLKFIKSIGYQCYLINPDGKLSSGDRFEVNTYNANLSNYALKPSL